MARLKLLIGISLFWLALSMLGDGLNTLILPNSLLGLVDESYQATMLGAVTLVGLLLGMFVQPVAGLVSDQLRPRWGRRGPLAVGGLLILVGLTLFGFSRSLAAVFITYALLQMAVSVAQAAQQGFLPDLIPASQRGAAAGLKGFMDLGGALLGFVVLGQLLSRGENNFALLAIGIVVLLTFLLTVGLVKEPQKREAFPASRRITFADAFRIDLRRHQSFAWLVGARFLFLLGTYAIGRFFLFFVADRLNLDRAQAAEQAGGLLAGLTLITALSAPLAGWAADRLGRAPVMLVGAGVSALGALLLIGAASPVTILLFGGLMAIGSAAFAGANWALTADLASPTEAARFFGLANFGTAGAIAAAGLFGPLVDWGNGLAPGGGYLTLFVAAGLLFLASAFAVWRAQPQARTAAFISESTLDLSRVEHSKEAL